MATKDKVWEIEVPEKRSGGGDYILPPEDNHPAVCVGVIDLGTQRQPKYQSAEMEDVHLIYLLWELVEIEGQPVLGRQFRASLHEKSGLRHFVNSWVGQQRDGEKFNVFSLAGKPCLLNVIHEVKEKGTFARIEGATPLPRIKGKPMELSAPSHEPVALTVEEFAEVPKWVPKTFGKYPGEMMVDSLELRGARARDDDRDEYVPDDD